MPPAIRPLLLLVCLLCSAASASALQFRVLSWSGPIEGLGLRRDGTTLPVIAHERTLSPARELAGAGPVELVRERPGDGRPVIEVLAVVNPPAGMNRGILVDRKSVV